MKASLRLVQSAKKPLREQPVCDRGSHLPAISATPTASATKLVERVVPADQPVEDELGHWRNRWDVPEKHAHLARRQGALPLGDGTWLGYRRFPTSGAAENEAQRYAQYNFLMFSIRYVGPEFFPDY